jgi:hypothetical protein
MSLERLPIFLSHDKCNPFLVTLQISSRPIKMHQVAVLLLLLLNGHISTGLPDVIRIGEFKIIASLPIYANSCEIFNEKCHFCMKGKFISLSAAARKNFARDSRSSSQADESAAARDHFSSALISLSALLLKGTR